MSRLRSAFRIFGTALGLVKGRDVLLAGPPRSGTTLVCWLLDKLPNVIALPEPMDVGRVMQHNNNLPAAHSEIRLFLETARRQILWERKVAARLVQGAIGTNFHEEPDAQREARKVHMTMEPLSINKPLTRDFLLLIKHPALFTGMLPALQNDFEVFATVRHPLATLASWNTLQADFRRGRASPAEAFSPTLGPELEILSCELDRQVHLLSFYFSQIRRLPRARVIRYEDVVSSGGAALGVITPAAAILKVEMPRYDVDKRYAGVPLDDLRMRLKRNAAAFEGFYDDL